MSAQEAATRPIRKRKNRNQVEYAVYRGEEMVAMGTAIECAEELGVTDKYITWMSTPSGQKRAKKWKNPTTVVKFDEEDDDDE
ncbi:hypothetical protein CWR48_13965 [Oceanobacillus arenosus]|uniref:Uncharacterized protein n=2 Tax=Oceanobacillus arenosus TaxID=1229153 RepID=A0A3D8PPM0_9BACI|nr:hypothetical protein CWR48_13965 [Oceanobacillus arenosus]